MFRYLGRFDVAEIEREHSEALLEFVDILGPLMVEARRDSSRLIPFILDCRSFPLHAPLGAVVVAKLLQYAQSVGLVRTLYLYCEHQLRAFHPDEVEQLVNSILNLKQLDRLEIPVDMTGALCLELCARLKDLQSLSYFNIHADVWDTPEELPKESQLIRNIQQISSLEALHLSFVVLGESTVNLFSSSETAYTKLHLNGCQYLIGDDDNDRDPSVLPLAVALANNTQLQELLLGSVQGSGEFWQAMEHGLLNNRTLQTLWVFDGPAFQMIPDHAYIGLMQSIRLSPSLRRLVLDMSTWTGRVADAVCSLVRTNTSLRSLNLLLVRDVEEDGNTFDPEWIGAVLQALQVNRTMVDVGIRTGSDFGERNWNRLVELLNANDSIELVNLDAGNDSTPERVIELLQRVKSNRTLKRLGATYACFEQKHASLLEELLVHNFSLLSLVHNHSYPDEEGLRGERMTISCSDGDSERLLTSILDLNCFGRKYMATEPNSVVHGVSLLSHVSSNLDAIYFHIRENPRLCDRREWKQNLSLAL